MIAFVVFGALTTQLLVGGVEHSVGTNPYDHFDMIGAVIWGGLLYEIVQQWRHR